MPKNALTNTETQKHLDAAYTIIEKAATKKGEQITKKTYGNSGFFGGYYPGNSTLGELGEHWRSFTLIFESIDCAYLSPTEQAALRRLLTTTVQKRALKTAYLILANNYRGAATYVQKNMPYQKVWDFQRAQAKRYARKELAGLTPDTTANNNDPATVTPTAPEPVPMPAFPQLTRINPNLDAAVENLQTLWQAATTIPDLSLEDTFLLTETATTYLPDAWRMYANLATLPEHIQQQAAAMLLLQVEALTSRIRTITDTIGENALKELKAHTTFITDKGINPAAAAAL